MSKKTRKKPNRARRSSPKIRSETGGRNLTSQAGLIPVIKFLDGLGFRGCLGTHFRNSLKIGRLDKINPLF